VFFALFGCGARANCAKMVADKFKASYTQRPQIFVFVQEVLLFYCTLYMTAQVTGPLLLRVTKSVIG